MSVVFYGLEPLCAGVCVRDEYSSCAFSSSSSFGGVPLTEVWHACGETKLLAKDNDCISIDTQVPPLPYLLRATQISLRLTCVFNGFWLGMSLQFPLSFSIRRMLPAREPAAQRGRHSGLELRAEILVRLERWHQRKRCCSGGYRRRSAAISCCLGRRVAPRPAMRRRVSPCILRHAVFVVVILFLGLFAAMLWSG